MVMFGICGDLWGFIRIFMVSDRFYGDFTGIFMVIYQDL